jgi:hypothetical protein
MYSALNKYPRHLADQGFELKYLDSTMIQKGDLTTTQRLQGLSHPFGLPFVLAMACRHE